MKSKLTLALDPLFSKTVNLKRAMKTVQAFASQLEVGLNAVSVVSPDSIHVPINFDLDALEKYEHASRNSLRARMHTLGETQIEPQPIIQPLKSTTKSVEALLRAVNPESTRAVVVYTHLSSGFRFTLHGSFISQLIEKTKTPVLAINAKSNAQLKRVSRVLFATDFSRGSKRALNEAIEWSQKLGAELIIFTVSFGLPNSSAGNEFVAGGSEKIDSYLKNQRIAARRSGNKFLKICEAAGVQARVKIVESATFDLAGSILKAAKRESCDLLFLHSNSTARGSLIFGSTTRDVLKKSSSPVVVVP